MLVLEDSDMNQLNDAAQYNAWKGQLYIHEQLVCNIAFQALSACSIPAQLPQKLDLNEVIQLSELRKKLPEDLFQKPDSTGQEVSCGNIYYSLYSVITSNIVGSELDKLLKCLKDQDVALIKVLNDQGFLILVNSAVLQSDTGICDGNLAQLNALFLFPHKKCLDEREREEWAFMRKDLPLTISNLLPGLNYAVIESSKLRRDKALYPGPLVEQYFKKYAVLQMKKDSSSERKSDKTEPLSVLSHGDDLPKKCSPLAFSCLQLYVSSPVNFSIPLIKMSNILAENASLSSNSDHWGKTVGNLLKQDSLSLSSKASKSKAARAKIQGKRAVREDKEQHSKRSTKRKSVRKKKSKRKPAPRAALTTAETSENKASNKRRRLHSEGKNQIVSSSKATVKLASASYPQRRKRGAEVLTAALIQDDTIQTTDKTASSVTNEENTELTQKTKAIKRKPRKTLAPEDVLVPERLSKRKASNPGNKKSNERNNGKTRRTIKKGQEKMKTITVEQMNTSSKSNENLRYAKKPPLSAQISENSMMERRISMYESHALNLLADLALNSFGSTSIPYLQIGNVASTNEVSVEEAASTGDGVEHPLTDCNLPSQSTTIFPDPEHVLESEIDKPKNGLNVSPRNAASQKRMETSEKQISQKAHIAAAKAKARYNATSKICLEHSYSQLPIDDIPGKSAREANEQPIYSVPDTTTPADPSANGPLGEIVLTSENVCPATGKKQRAVSKHQDNFAITFHWEPNYDFDLDSKFTSDPLEKTVNRALHGPWNPHLKEKVEDVKIILHMWIALFYSKSNKPITCSSRKVVEHSNPAKYVSINTVLDPFEFYEIMESDGVHEENTDVGKVSESLLRQGNPLETVLSRRSGKSERKRVQDLAVPSSIPTKDYNIKLSSEIFQMCKNSESAFYSDSLQTSMACKGARTPANVMNTNFGSNVPTVCYIGNPNLFNTELTDKSENCMDIAGFSSEKAKSKEIEHKYSKAFSIKHKAQKSAGSPTDCTTARADADRKEGKVCETVASAGSTSRTYSDRVRSVTPPPTGGSPVTSDKKGEYSSAESKTLHSPEIPSADDLNKGNTRENLSSVELSSENDENSEDEHSDLSIDLFDAKGPPGVDSHKTAESQELDHHSADADEPGKSPDVALQNPESNDDQNSITYRFSAMGIESPSDHSDEDTELCMKKSSDMVDSLMKEEALKCDKDSPGINHVGTDNFPTAESLDTNVHSKSIQGEDISQVGGLTDNIANDLGSQKRKIEGLEFCNSPDRSKNMDLNTSVDYDRNCTKESKADCVSVGMVDGQEQEMETLPDESGHLVEPKNIQKLDGNLLNEGLDMWTASPDYGQENEQSYVSEITAADTMSRLELSNSSDEESDGECSAKSCTPDQIKSDEQGSISKSLKESSEKVEGKEEHRMNTSVQHSMPAINRDKSVVPKKDENGQEMDVHEPVSISEARMVEGAEKEVPGKPFLTLNIAHPCLSDDDGDLLNVAGTEEGTKEPSNRDVNLNSNRAEESLPEAPNKEIPTDRAEESNNGACLVDEPSDGADNSELHGVASTSVLGGLAIEGSIETRTVKDSVQCEMHEGPIHEEQLVESQDHPLFSQAAFDIEKIKNNTFSVENIHKEDGLSGSMVKEVQIDALPAKADTVVNLGLSKDTLEGHSDVNDSNEKTLQPHITSSVSDLVMSKCSEMDSKQQPVEKPQPVHTGAGLTVGHKSSAKDSTHSSRSSSSNKREILSKLKRICLGTITGHQVSSSSENVLSRDKNSINGSLAKEKNEVIDVAKNSLPCNEDKSCLEISATTSQEPAIGTSSPEESAITAVISVEPESLEGVMDVAENSLPHEESAITSVSSVEPESLEGVMDVAKNSLPHDEDQSGLEILATTSQEPAMDTSSPEESAITAVTSIEPESLEVVMNVAKYSLPHDEDQSGLEILATTSQEPTMDMSSPEEFAITTVTSIEPESLEGVMDVAENSLPRDEDQSYLENSATTSQEPAMDTSSPEEPAITTVVSIEPESLEGVIPPQDNCLISPSFEDVSDSIEQDPSPEQPDICFIVNTGSISKEQYDRWSETSDDDIEYIRSYKEPLLHQEYVQEEIPESPNLLLNKEKCPEKQSTTSRTKRCSKRRSGSSSGLHETDENSSRHQQDVEYSSNTNHGNVLVTRNIIDPGRAVRTINKDDSRSDLGHLFSDRRMASDDLTQNTLDMENVRFMCKLKDILRKSSTDKQIYGPPFQTVFQSRKIASCSHASVKSRGPLQITVQCPYRRTDFRRHEIRHPSTYNSSPYHEEELLNRPVTYSKSIRKVRTRRYLPFHFSRLRYEKTLDKSNADISVILNECVQSNHIKLSSIGSGNTAVDRTSASQLEEEGRWQERRNVVPVSSKTRSVKNIISDLCTSLHSRLQNVARASEQKISFYIYQTDDGNFVSSTKSLLVKDGHIPTDPRDFLNSEGSESAHQLLVVIKNEDVISCINKIPYLMQLKLLPNVTFAGVDTPEDITESTYEELFHAGGFVASDKTVLENLTLGKLKEVLAVLEKMNRTSPWKWLIHYRENRKLKENKRAETLSGKKMCLLKSYQQLNVVEILPYHQCDSRSKEPSDELSCLLNLQYQHIHSRLAVYLTGATSMVTEEYEQNGILVYDVETFLRKIQKDSRFQASYWS